MLNFVAARRGPCEFARLSGTFEGCRGYEQIHRAVRGYVLAVTAPADSDRDRLG